MGSCAKAIRPDFLTHQFKREMTTSMQDIERRSLGGFDPLLLHYRHFRNRFHAGRVPQHRIKLVPLGSRLLEDCAVLAGGHRLKTAQILYDIMASTVPELLDIPFDTKAKTPRANVRAALTSVPVREDLAPGAFFAPKPDREDAAAGERERPIDGLRRAFDAALATPFVSAFCGEALVAQAEEVLSRAQRAQSFASVVETQPISVVLTSAMVRP